MAKVLLLASRPDADLERILLFDRADDDTIQWLLFEGDLAVPMASPFAAYTKLAARTQARPGLRELEIDRAWAINAVRTMIAAAN
jgi:hypothetical protein